MKKSMKRLYVLAEGQTEADFLTLVVAPHLLNFGIVLQPTMLETGTNRTTGGKTRGGVSNYAPIAKDINNLLYDCRFKEVWLTTMLDFYKLPRDFPGYDNLPSNPPIAQVKHLEKELKQAWAEHEKGGCLIPYIQLHEFETLLLCDVNAFDWAFIESSDAKAIAALKKEIAAFSSPEEINGGEATAPSKRIIRHLPSYAREKTTSGILISEKIGLAKMRSSCPHFDDWIIKLENLALEL